VSTTSAPSADSGSTRASRRTTFTVRTPAARASRTRQCPTAEFAALSAEALADKVREVIAQEIGEKELTPASPTPPA